jgi:ribosomal protein S8
MYVCDPLQVLNQSTYINDICIIFTSGATNPNTLQFVAAWQTSEVVKWEPKMSLKSTRMVHGNIMKKYAALWGIILVNCKKKQHGGDA